MNVKKYIRDEIDVIIQNIDIIKDVLSKDDLTKINRTALDGSLKTLIEIHEIFSDEDSDILLIEGIYDRLPGFYQRLERLLREN